jgi:Holliday junction resolvasome RuvABC endonuclease subunit
MVGKISKQKSTVIEKVNPEDAIILGIDPSLNGSGFIKMKNFEILDFWFFTNVLKHSSDPHAILNRETGSKRLNIIYEFYEKLLKSNDFDYCAIEDYAYGAKSNSIFQIGGLGELLRLMTYRSGIPYRDYEPSKVKRFATGSGTAEKSEMVLAAYKSGFDVSKYGKNGEDLVDAYWIGNMLTTELFLHKNKDYIGKFTRKQQEVFNETTKSYPIPLLNRQFYK